MTCASHKYSLLFVIPASSNMDELKKTHWRVSNYKADYMHNNAHNLLKSAWTFNLKTRKHNTM